MLKLLLLAVVVWLVVVLLRHYRRGVDAPRAAKPEDMVRCAECGVFLPKSASILKHGAYYCCQQHSDRAGK